jgi:hypothetical protein
VAIAFDAITSNTASGSGDDVSFTHTPVGTPRGVLVFVTFAGSFSGTVDQVTSTPTYGGVSMAEVPLSMLNFSGTEDKQVHAFFLGSSIPTGPQTVAFTVDTILAYTECITYTAAADTEVVDTTPIGPVTDSGDITGVLSLGGRTCAAAMGFVNGSGLPDDTTPLTDWTQQRETDHGSLTSGVHTYDIVGTADVTFGTTEAVSTHIIVLGVAVSEVVSAGAYTLDADSATYTYSATAAGVEHNRLIDAAAASYAYTANDATLEHGWLIDAGNAAYTWTATDAALEYTPIGTTYTLDADAAAYLYTATDADLVYVQLQHYLLDADSAAYTYTANDAGLEYSGAETSAPVTYGGGGSGRDDDLERRVRNWWAEIDSLRAQNREREAAEREKTLKAEKLDAERRKVEAQRVKTKKAKESRAAELSRLDDEIEQAETETRLVREEMERTLAEIGRLETQIQLFLRRRSAMALLMIAAST